MNILNECKLSNKKIIIWGGGQCGKRIFFPLVKNNNCIIAYADSNPQLHGTWINAICVIPPQEIVNQDFDYVIIAVQSTRLYGKDVAEKIKDELISYGITQDRIIDDIMHNPEYYSLMEDERMSFIKYYSQFIYENNIQGNIAECGVFAGDSAKFINRYFPDRKLYLFDTFEGFAEQDVIVEEGFNEESFKDSGIQKGYFKETSIEIVMRKMPFPENVVIRKGWFPESAEGVIDKFAFVNLDMDIYQPMINGLRFFWDKMDNGGCILCHDYYYESLPGVKRAILDFEKERNRMIVKTPIGDECSIALFKD